MKKSLLDLRFEIIKSDNMPEDWLRLDSEVNEAMKHSSTDEIQEFVDSGAGEMLDMACSAVLEMQKKRQ